MNIVIMIFVILVIGIFVGLISFTKVLERDIKKIKDKLFSVDINNIYIPERKYDEYCVKPLNIYTTFRVVPFTNGLGEKVWDVEYRNPADTTWKVCRCEKSWQEAYDRMQELITKIKEGEI